MKKINNSINVYLQLLKTAIAVDDWVDDDIKERLERLPKIEKDPALVNFREKFIVPKGIYTLTKEEGEFINDYQENLRSLQLGLRVIDDFLHKDMPRDIMDRVGNSLLSNIKKTLPDIVNIINDIDNREFDEFIKNKIDLYDGSSIKATKFYERVRNLFEKGKVLVEQIWEIIKNNPNYKSSEKFFLEDFLVNHIRKTQFKKLEELDLFKAWQLRANINKEKNKNFEIVFTTKFKDIYGMSSRSEWTSCQNIAKFRKSTNTFESGIVGACAAKGIGIIYLTDNTDWEGRGERMIYRGTVWLIKHKKTEINAVIVMCLYPSYDKRIAQIFKSSLEKYLNIKVFMGDEANEEDLGEYFREIHEEEVLVDKPYRDFFIETKLTMDARFKKFMHFVDVQLRTRLQHGDFVYYNNPKITNAVKLGFFAVAKKMKEREVFPKIVKDLQSALEAENVPPFYIIEQVVKYIQDNSYYHNIYLTTVHNALLPDFGTELINMFEDSPVKSYIAYPTNVY